MQKESKPQVEVLTGRIYLLIAIAFIATTLLIARLWQIQMLKGQDFQKEISQQTSRIVRIPPVRGRIESSDGVILADTIPSYDIDLYVSEFRRAGSKPRWNTRNHYVDIVTQLAKDLHRDFPQAMKSLISKIKEKSQERLKLFSELSYSEQQFLRREIEGKKEFYIINNSLFLDLGKITHLPKEGSFTRTVNAIMQRSELLHRRIKREHALKRKTVERHLKRHAALPLTIITNLNAKELAIASEIYPKLKGCTIVNNSRRHYPQKHLASHLIGFVSRQAPEKEKDFSEYSFFLPEYSGRNGAEGHYDKYLRGTGGRRTSVVNISGYTYHSDDKNPDGSKAQPFAELDIEAKNGSNVILTLNSKAQKIANKLLKGKKGAIVFMNSKTGHILAAASGPSFDISRRNHINYVQALSSKPDHVHRLLWSNPLLNRAFYADYFPGSTVKPLIALSALQNGVYQDKDIIECDGRYCLNESCNARIRCHGVHGPVDLYSAIEQSCNPYFVHAGLKLGGDKLHDLYKSVGIGRFPLDFANSRYNQGSLPIGHSEPKKPWYPGDSGYISIGQGKISASPLQVALYTAGIANKGTIMQPQILKEVRHSLSAEVLEERKPLAMSHMDIDQEHFKKVHEAMYQVVYGDNASARKAQPETIEIAGKTGTAQRYYYVNLRDSQGKILKDSKGKNKTKRQKLLYTWFTSFAPYNDPEYVLTIMIEEGQSGGSTCAPLAKKFYNEFFGASE